MNTQRIVNFRVSQSKSLYVYNEDYTILYHTSRSITALKQELGIHHSNIKASLLSGELFLGAFRITDKYYAAATTSSMSLQELNGFIDLKRKEALLKNKATAVYLYNRDLTVLYYSASSSNALKSELKISMDSSINCIRTGDLYLDYFRITKELVPGVDLASISLNDLKDLLETKRQECRNKNLKLGFGYAAIKV